MHKVYTDIKAGTGEHKTLRYKVCGGNDEGEYLLVISDRKQRRIPLSAIKYVESCARKLTLYLRTEEVCFYAKLDDVEPVLKKRGFVRTHQSYMVRISEIRDCNRDCISIDGIQIPVSRRYYNNVKDITNKIRGKNSLYCKPV